ncbi:MAG: homoserine kinase [Chloroflexi bacterium UTCFX4]|nr:MAG: homoserine kinase [Chloroflexi bacterium UTCFX4]
MRYKIDVPATTANLGPGFDCLGLALDWWNTIQVEPSETLCVKLRGLTENIPADANNMTLENMRCFFERIGKPAPSVKITMTNRIPIGRGLGSSAAALVGGLVAGNLLAGEPLSRFELLELANELEGHPDNVSAALFGGFAVSTFEGARVTSASVEPPRAWRAVLFIHDHALSTKYAREILPKKIARADAVHNIGRAALLTFAFLTENVELLAVGMQDRLHQPYREHLVQGMPELLAAARAAGAGGAALSGAGPSLLALTASPQRAARVRDAMRDTARRLRVNGETHIVKLSVDGARVTPLK